MRRKVVLNGLSTLTVSLPTRWAKKYNIKKGDELEVEETDEMLKISVDKDFIQSKSTKIDLKDLSEKSIKYLLGVLHKSGYDEIRIFFNNPKKVKIIQTVISSMLMGYEIIEVSDKSCLVKSVTNTDFNQFSNLLRRSFLVSLSLAKDSLETIKSRNFDKLDEILVLEETNNRLTNLCERILNKKLSTSEKTTYYYIIVWLLESICDDYRNIIKFIIKNKNIKISKSVITLYQKVNKLFENYYSLFYRYDDTKMDDLRNEYEKLSKEILSSMYTKNKEDIALAVHLHNLSNRILDALGSTIGLNH